MALSARLLSFGILGFLVLLFFSISIVKITTNQPQREAEGAEAAEHS